MNDIRYAFRQLRRRPAFTLLAIATLAVGVGATTSVFALLHGTLFRSLPFPNAHELVAVHLTREEPGEGIRQLRWSHPEFEALASSASGFAGLAAFGSEGFNLTGEGEPVRVAGEIVSAGYFDVLGVQPLRGRTFRPEEGDAPGAHPVTVISHQLWSSRFAGDPEAVGRTVRVNGFPLTVVGVTPEGFQGLTGPADLWITHAMAPLVTFPEQLTTHQHFLNVVGRLEEGVRPESVRAALGPFADLLTERFAAEHEGDARWATSVESLDSARTDPAVRRERLLLFAAVLLVLLMAGADLAGLLLGRTLARRRELAIRRALGCSRARLVRQLVSESLLLAVAGGTVGILLALGGARLADSLLPPAFTGAGYGRLFQFTSVSVDGWVVAFAFGASLLVGVGFGLTSALVATRETGAGGPGHRNDQTVKPTDPTSGVERSFSGLVMGQFALAVVLLVGAGLLLQTFVNLRGRDPGYDPERIVTFRLSPPSTRYGPDEAPDLLAEILERVRAVPGVEAASVSPCTPFMSCPTRLVRRPPGEGADEGWLSARRHYVAPRHLGSMGIALLRGRDIAETDGPDGPNVVVVSRTMAERLWGGEDPVGRELVFQGAELNFVNGDSSATVVGVAEDVPYGGPADPPGLDIYTPYRQFAWPSTYVSLRSVGPSPQALVPLLRQAVREVDPDLPIHDLRDLGERRAEALATPRFNTILLSSFAGLALFLASLGIYGMMSQYVGRRRREMAVRQAVGAGPGRLLTLVVQRGMRYALWGMAAGVGGALLGTRALESQLYGVPPADPRILFGAVSCLALVGLLAVALPALRASRVDPMVTLREE